MKIDKCIQYWAHMLDEAMFEKGIFEPKDSSVSNNGFVFFWGCGPKNRVQKGCFSQWWPCRFTVDGVQYSSAEQYMMAEKARVFGDSENLNAILASSSPKDIKAYGRAVRNFNPSKWNAVKFDIVVKGNIAKFSQNPELKRFLLSTGEAELVEASPKDRIWGIGLSEDDPRALDKSKWLGSNLLGRALMEVRDKLRNSNIKIFESYAVTPSNNIWSRAGHAIELSKLKAELNKNGIAKPLFLNKDFERTEWYSNTKDIQDVDCFVAAIVDQSVNFCDITSADDLQTLGFLPIFADKIAISCYVNAFNELAQKFNISINQFKYFPSMLMCNFNNIFQNIKLKQQQSLIKNNAYSEFEILFDNNINKEEKNGNGTPELLDGYKCLLLTLNKYFQTHPGIADLRSLKGAGTDFLQLVFFNMIASAGYDGFFCREIDRSSLIPKYDTIALFNADKILSIDNFTYNYENKDTQFYNIRYKYDSEYRQKINNRIKAKEEEQAKLNAERKAKEEEQAKLNAERKAKEEEQAKLNAERKAKEEEQAKLNAIKFQELRRKNYIQWCQEIHPAAWVVYFEAINNPNIRYGVQIVGCRTTAEANAVAEKIQNNVRQKFNSSAYGSTLTLNDFGLVGPIKNTVKITNISNNVYEKIYQTSITPELAVDGYPDPWRIIQYSTVQDSIWFKFKLVQDGNSAQYKWRRIEQPDSKNTQKRTLQPI